MRVSRNFLLLGETDCNTEQFPLQSNSAIEKMICDPNFSYLQPWFYNHPYALRCELGTGDTCRIYMKNAYKRALEIFSIIFPDSPDAMMFDYVVEDYSYYDKIYINNILKKERDDLRFLLDHYSLYPHRVVRNIPVGEDDDHAVRRNRIICYSNGKTFNHKSRIREQLYRNGHTVSYISFENECIYSVYDDRGCDIVFATKEKMKEFFEKLNPYLFYYDMDNMLKRLS